jgi:hypothetical protein
LARRGVFLRRTFVKQEELQHWVRAEAEYFAPSFLSLRTTTPPSVETPGYLHAVPVRTLFVPEEQKILAR